MTVAHGHGMKIGSSSPAVANELYCDVSCLYNGGLGLATSAILMIATRLDGGWNESKSQPVFPWSLKRNVVRQFVDVALGVVGKVSGKLFTNLLDALYQTVSKVAHSKPF